jgi:predicted amino acid-binding ACT domain protein
MDPSVAATSSSGTFNWKSDLKQIEFVDLSSIFLPKQNPALRAFSASNNTAHLIVNAAGLDRLGIVSDVTGLVIAHGGNVGESVAGRLSSTYFSLMMLVSVPEANREALQRDILAVPDLRSAVFAVDGTHADQPAPAIGCTCLLVIVILFIELLMVKEIHIGTTHALLALFHQTRVSLY